MKALQIPKLAVVALTALLSSAADAQSAYDLTGEWLLIGSDAQQSFCDGSTSREVIVASVIITQSDDAVTMNIAGENTLTGRTSKNFVAVEELAEEATTVLNGTVSPDASWIAGTIVFFDKHPCPDAETGQARFLLLRLTS